MRIPEDEMEFESETETPQELIPIEKGEGCCWNTLRSYEIYELCYEDYELRIYINDIEKYCASFSSYTKAKWFMYWVQKWLELMWRGVREYLW